MRRGKPQAFCSRSSPSRRPCLSLSATPRHAANVLGAAAAVTPAVQGKRLRATALCSPSGAIDIPAGQAPDRLPTGSRQALHRLPTGSPQARDRLPTGSRETLPRGNGLQYCSFRRIFSSRAAGPRPVPYTRSGPRIGTLSTSFSARRSSAPHSV